MKSILVCRIVLIVQVMSSVLCFLPVRETRAVEPHVFISEIAWAGSSLSTADEWIELANPTEQDVDVTGWKINGAGASGKALVFPNESLIPAGGAYLISNYPSDDAHCALNIEPNVVTTTISLSNTVIDVQLFDADGQLVDRAGDGHAPPAGYSSEVKASMIRMDYLVSGDLAEAWQTSNSIQNIKTSDFGTPGIVDIIIPLPNPLPIEPEFTTSTELIIEESNTTTTEELLLPSNTSTEDAIDLPLPEMSSSSTEVTTTTELILETATSTQELEELVTPTSVSDQSNYQFLRLNEVMPDPSSGPEWVEITNAMPDRSITFDSLELHDAVGKIMTIKGSVTSGHLYVVINLSSARLNNSGDSLYLKTPDGLVLDTLTYASSKEDISWARDTQGAWRETTLPTPGLENTVIEITSIVTQTSKYEPTTPKAVKKTTSTKTTKPAVVKVPAKQSTSTTKTVAASTKKSATPKIQTAAEKKTTATKAAAVKKTTTSKSTSSVKPAIFIDFDMLQDDTYGGIRVRLQGVAGSPARLLASRAFVLLSQEGRGLLVKVPSGLRMPTIGSPLEVTGTLKFDTHDFPYLTLTKNDRITELKKSTTSFPREIIWLAPAMEDAWSLVSATGTVQAVSGSTVNLLVDDAEVDLKIKSGVAYRTSRLKKGDVITVTGILDMTSQRPAILPRAAEEIILLTHAPASVQQATEQPKASGLPGWTPFGAALGAIGAVEGVKKLRKKKTTPVKV